MIDPKNPYMLGKVAAYKADESGDTVEDEHNEVFEVVEYTPESGLVEIGYDGPKNMRLYVTLPLAELVAKAAAFGRK